LTLTPSDPSRGVKTTNLIIAANETTALDDIVHHWYGGSTPGERAGGVLLVAPARGRGKGLEGGLRVNSVAVASTRTHNVSTTGQATSHPSVLPGVAVITNGLANWSSDVRIYNAATAAPTATLTFYPLNSGGTPLANSLIRQAGEVKSLDDIVKSYYGLDNGG